MDMKPGEVVQAFQRAVEQGDWETVDEILTDDFVFGGPTPEPLGRRACISMHKALWAAFPDIQFHTRIISEVGEVVKATAYITGTHTGNLIPPVSGKFVNIPPTGRKIALAEETIEYTVRGNQLAGMDVQASEDASWSGIFNQIGVENPYK